jgi:hypothetical protein
MFRRTVLVSRLALTLAAGLLAACSSAGPPRPSGSSPDVLSAREIEKSGVTNAYDAVRKYRANFLSYRGETSMQANRSNPLPNVYLDGARYGDLAALRTIPVGQIAYIRLYRAYEAQQRFGAGNMGGVIEVVTPRQ